MAEGRRGGRLATFLRYRAGELWRRVSGDRGVRDVFGRGGHVSRHALLVYLTEPFRLGEAGGRLFAHHQIWWRNLTLAELLDERGFSVDVISSRGEGRRPREDYELVVGVGPVCRRIAAELPDSTTKIYVATGAEPGFLNRQEADRLEAIAQRRNCELEPRRRVAFDVSELAVFDAVLVVGNGVTAETFAPYHDWVLPFDNVGNEDVEVPERDFGEARRHFLYFASRGQVLKGLDLLLEVFAVEPDLHLHVAGLYEEEEDFVACYRRELHETPNVHPHGWLRLGGPAFREVAGRCSTVIHPSAAEGQAGSVIDCMMAGLVPVVSRETGVDVEGFGVRLPSSSLDDIRRAVREVAERPADWHREASARTREAALSRHSKLSGRRRLGEPLDRVLENRESAGDRE